MTRINLVEPSQLTNKHLLAEYKEITWIPYEVLSLQHKGLSPEQVGIPLQYTLGENHVKFFLDKCIWIARRHQRLVGELKRRNYELNEWKFRLYYSRYILIDKKWKNDWQPSPEEIYLNMARLCKLSKIETVLNELAS